MKRIHKSKTYPDEGSFAPIIYIMYYDEDFVIYDTRIKLSAEFIQELNSMGVPCFATRGDQESKLLNDMIEFYQVLEKNELDINDIDINEIEKEYLDELLKIEINSVNAIARYDETYLLRLDNVKQLRRLKNLSDLGV